ncbi:hypothetical protein AAMO2058_000547400 [Amorphochlora amoebiformis]
MGHTASITDHLFHAIDEDNSGNLTKDELIHWFGYQIPYLTQRDKTLMLTKIQDSKTISKSEFANFFKKWTADQLDSASATIVRLHNINREVLDILNKLTDQTEHGYISLDDLVGVLNTDGALDFNKQIRGLSLLLDPEDTGQIKVEDIASEFLRHFKLAGLRKGFCPCVLCEYLFHAMEQRHKQKVRLYYMCA